MPKQPSSLGSTLFLTLLIGILYSYYSSIRSNTLYYTYSQGSSSYFYLRGSIYNYPYNTSTISSIYYISSIIGVLVLGYPLGPYTYIILIYLYYIGYSLFSNKTSIFLSQYNYSIIQRILLLPLILSSLQLLTKLYSNYSL